MPLGGVVADAQGRLYGTTALGGAFDSGAVFRLTPPPSGQGEWAEEILHSFGGPTGIGGGGAPFGPVTLGPDGSIYGTTTGGGPTQPNGGTRGLVFKLANAPGWPLTVLHAFTRAEGAMPTAGLVFGADGLLYGSTPKISYDSYAAMGTVFSVSPLGDQVEYALVHIFGKGTDGSNPQGALVNVPPDYLVGVTPIGGPTTAGTVYPLHPAPNGVEVEHILYTFNLSNDVQAPVEPPFLGTYALRKTLVGCGIGGGTHGRGGIYQLKANGHFGAAETVLYNFGDQPNDPGEGNGFSRCFVVQGEDSGKIYGTTEAGGLYGQGTFFELDPPKTPGAAWKEKVDVSFDARSPGGADPAGGILRQGQIYYGTTLYSLVNQGAVFQLIP